MVPSNTPSATICGSVQPVFVLRLTQMQQSGFFSLVPPNQAATIPRRPSTIVAAWLSGKEGFRQIKSSSSRPFLPFPYDMFFLIWKLYFPEPILQTVYLSSWRSICKPSDCFNGFPFSVRAEVSALGSHIVAVLLAGTLISQEYPVAVCDQLLAVSYTHLTLPTKA